MENNQINNVGDPSNENDAVNIRTLSSSGMKPTRIYRAQISTGETVYVVPTDKLWKLIINHYTPSYNTHTPRISINGVRIFYQNECR